MKTGYFLKLMSWVFGGDIWYCHFSKPICALTDVNYKFLAELCSTDMKAEMLRILKISNKQPG